MPQLAILDAGAPGALPRLLRALGAEFRAWAEPESLVADQEASRHQTALILSEAQLVAAARIACDRDMTAEALLSGFHPILVFPFGATPDGLRALSQLMGSSLEAAAPGGDVFTYRVQESREICGPFAGLQFGPGNRSSDRPLAESRATGAIEWLVTVGGAGLFGRSARRHSEVFVNSTTAIFDVTAGYAHNLNAAECFAALVPLLCFIRHCGTPLFRATRAWANWIIDDPNLAPRYGFIRANQLAEAASRAEAAITIAFIPWNHNRTDSSIVNLFRARWPQLSICIHGCNHTRSEFATSGEMAYELGALALARMRRMEAETGLGFEKVMVFPQGKFSRRAMSALRRLGLLAAANTEVADAETGLGVLGGDLLQPALTCYGGFPLFLRRPADASLANFALDLLLGKPCLIVTHHDYFRRGVGSLVARVNALKALEPAMVWTSLEEGISTTAAIRTNPDESLDVRLFVGRTYLRLHAPSEMVLFTKLEPAEEPIRVLFNGQLIPSRRQGDELCFDGQASGGRYVRVDVEGTEQPRVAPRSLRGRAPLKTAARRYLSEFRDNYVDRSTRLGAALNAARDLAARHL